MSKGLSPTENIVNDICIELRQGEDYAAQPLGSFLDTDELRSLGKSAASSIYVEGFLAIDSLPRTEEAFSGYCSLSEEGVDLLSLLDQAIDLNPLFSQSEYEKGKRAFDFPLVIKSPISPLTREADQEHFAERGLAALYQGVMIGFSSNKLPPVSKQWRWMIPEKVRDTMILNNSLDVRASKAVRSVKEGKKYTTQEFITGLIAIAEDIGTEPEVEAKVQVVTTENDKDREIVLNGLRRGALLTTLGFYGGEIAHIFLSSSPHPHFDWKSTAAGAVAGLVAGGKMLDKDLDQINERHKQLKRASADSAS
jgi:hypothetical protein